MAGQSKKEQASQSYYDEIGGQKTDVKNRFEDYQNPFDYGKVEGKLDDVFGGYEDIINRDTAEQIAKQQAGAASSLASRGITGGSALTDTQSGIASGINKGKMNALSTLGSNKAGMLGDLMKYFNQMKFAQTGAATDVDFGNIGNLFQKLGLKGGAIAGLDDDTWLDDMFGGMTAAGELAKGIGSIAGGGGAGAASDIRFKENLKNIGKINGINIYSFNYIGDTRRFIGVIAQEVESIPGAVISYGGYKFVNYSKLGIPFEEI